MTKSKTKSKPSAFKQVGPHTWEKDIEHTNIKFQIHAQYQESFLHMARASWARPIEFVVRIRMTKKGPYYEAMEPFNSLKDAQTFVRRQSRQLEKILREPEKLVVLKAMKNLLTNRNKRAFKPHTNKHLRGEDDES